jgi:hypothetical protein
VSWVNRSLLYIGAALIMAVLATVVGGCSTQPPPPLAPPIPGEQLDVARYTTTPCDLLRADRVARHHLNPPGTVVTHEGGLACQWAPTIPAEPSITADVNTTLALEQLYQRRAEFSSFQPTNIAHYPAVDTTTDPRGPSGGSCTVQVGVADRSTVQVTAAYSATDGNRSTDPCADANELATAIIGQLGAGTP